MSHIFSTSIARHKMLGLELTRCSCCFIFKSKGAPRWSRMRRSSRRFRKGENQWSAAIVLGYDLICSGIAGRSLVFASEWHPLTRTWLPNLELVIASHHSVCAEYVSPKRVAAPPAFHHPVSHVGQQSLDQTWHTSERTQKMPWPSADLVSTPRITSHKPVKGNLAQQHGHNNKISLIWFIHLKQLRRSVPIFSLHTKSPYQFRKNLGFVKGG